MMNIELNPTERRILAKSYAERIAVLLDTTYDESDRNALVEMASRMMAIIETLPAVPRVAKAA